MNHPNDEELMMNNNQINQNKNSKHIISINYPKNTINKGKIFVKKPKIKNDNINPEIIAFELKDDFYSNMPRPIQNLEPYQKKDNNNTNQYFEDNETNSEYLMPKHSIKSNNSSKINTKINNQKYMNKNKINNLDNFDNDDMLYKNYLNNNISKNAFNILGKNSGKINQKKIKNFNSNNPNNTSDLKMTKSSIQISGKPFQKKHSYNHVHNAYDSNVYQKALKNDKNINVNLNITNKIKKEYNYKSDNLIKELKTNKINNNKKGNSMELEKYEDINFIQPDNEYNNIFFYSSKTNNIPNNTNDTFSRYKNNLINNNNNKKINSAKEKIKNKFIYKKIKNISKKEEPIKDNNIKIKKTEIKNNLKNNFNIVDFVIKLPLKDEKISINIKENNDNIKEKIENLINKNELNNSYLEPLLSLVNNSINILKNVNTFKLSKMKRFNLMNKEELVDDLNFSFILYLHEKNKYKDFFEKSILDIDDINENKKLLNMSV